MTLIVEVSDQHFAPFFRADVIDRSVVGIQKLRILIGQEYDPIHYVQLSW
jgi:hypothetical protein